MVAPDFLNDDNRPQAVAYGTFRPYPANRRSEAVAWALTLALALISLLDRWRSAGTTPFLGELAAFFGVISLWVSFGNWIDCRTSVETSADGLRYRSPLRTISLEWESVDELWAIPSGSSWRIVVRAGAARFGFRTASELRLGRRSLQVGFPEGERLAGMIRRRTGLGRPSRENVGWVCARRQPIPDSR